MSRHQLTTLVVREYLQALNCPESLSVWLLFKYGEHRQLIDKEFIPSNYNSLCSAKDALAAFSYLAKFPDLELSHDRKEVAKGKFFDAEHACKITNERLATVYDCEPEIFSVTRKIARILGDFDAEEFADSCSWGPGSTLEIRAHRATATAKFDNNVEFTPTCFNFARRWMGTAYPNWVVRSRLYAGNKVITVPKNAKTDRIIAVEPSGNLFLQKGIGAMIRRRLKRTGIDLSDQSHNQRLSRIGSKFNTLATIDFSAASDTIASGLVLRLIPQPWLDLLIILRSPYGYIDGSRLEYEKFSSMGNGFTFELESLIFYCVGLSCTAEEDHHCVSIYGDDLIVPSYAADRLLDVFSHLGFKINRSKSFYDGYYRESCGKHYWNGSDITPIYLRETIQHETSVIKVYNAIRRYSVRGNLYGCDGRFKGVCDYLLKTARLTFKRAFLIPDGYGDGGFISNFDEATPPRLRHGIEGFRIKLLIEKPFERWTDSHGLLLSRLWCTIGSDRSHGNCEILPRRTRTKAVLSQVAVWRDLGPWLV